MRFFYLHKDNVCYPPLIFYTCYFQPKSLTRSLYVGYMRRRRDLSLGGAYKLSPFIYKFNKLLLIVMEWISRNEGHWTEQEGTAVPGLYLSLEASNCAGNLWWWRWNAAVALCHVNTEGKCERTLSYQDSKGVCLSPHTKCFLSLKTIPPLALEI